MRSHPALVLAAAVVQIGCYNYVSLRRAALSPTAYVAVTLTDAGSEELTPYLGPNVYVVRGRFLSTTERGLVMSVNAVETRPGNILEWKGETVVVPGEFVRSLEERHTAASKTVLLAGASLAGFFAAYAAFGPGASGSTASGGGQNPSSH